MKAYLSVDMEGIAGISHRDLVMRGTDSYPEGVALMTAETNAAIEGAYAGGATEVTSRTPARRRRRQVRPGSPTPRSRPSLRPS